MERTSRSRRDAERGASIVEFAIILPVFMALVLGAFTGAAAYNRKLSLVSAAREGSRLGATLPVSPVNSTCTVGSTDMDKWLNCIKTAVVQAAGGDLRTGGATRYVCVAYVNNTGSTGNGLGAADDQTSYAYWDSSDTEHGPFVGLATDVCDSNTVVSTERQVQVVVKQAASLQVALASTSLTLTASSVSRYERVTS
jgi:Flp pilus assembly protein TadG